MDRIRRHLSRRRQSSSSNRRTSLSSSSKNRNTNSHHLILISDTQDFDRTIIRRLEAEGFNTRYIPFAGARKDIERDRKDLENRLNELEDDLEPGERYAVIAYNLPAYLLLYSHHQSMTTTNPLPRLCALVAYYPSTPDYLPRNAPLCPCEPPSTASTGVSTYSASPLLPLQIHLASQQSPNLYDNYSLHPDRKRHRCHVFAYPDSRAGFAEHTSHTYDRVDAQLAWSRALDCIKRSFGPGGSSWTVSDIEAMWEGYWRRLKDNNARGTTGQTLDGNDDEPEDFFHYNPDDHEGGPSVNCIPTNVRAAGSYTSLKTFHATTFFPAGPTSQYLRLLTRTVGPDRIVDEALLSFSHSALIPWLLPGVPPSNRHVQVPLVLVGSFCAGGMARLNLYWDQASVLVQVGVLDPGTGLPVVAKEGVEGIIS